MMGYRCPNGHPTPAEKLVRCSQCRAFVTYEPAAVGLALRRQLISAVVVDDDALDRLAQLIYDTDESVRTMDDARGLADVYVEALRDG
jgi:hypothetical protein